MWPFKRKKKEPEPKTPGSNPECPFCRSGDTRVKTLHGSEGPDYIRAWRGQRYLTCWCNTCGREFYTEAREELSERALNEEGPVEDEEELRAAEEDLKREIEEQDDRRYG